MESTDFLKSDFLIRRDAPEDWRYDSRGPETAAGGVLLRINRVGLSSNNITYATSGNMLFRHFFPAEEGWTTVPVWGYGEVVASDHPDIAPGRHVFGFFPLSEYLTVTPGRVSATGFYDEVSHRQKLPGAYNRYQFLPEGGEADPLGDYDIIMRPLLMTSFVLARFLEEEKFFGARHVLVSSASAKTAFSTIWLLRRAGYAGLKITGLTAAGNREFVRGLDLYTDIVSYGELPSLSLEEPLLYIDVAGDDEINATIHRGAADMRHSCRLGDTHGGDRSVTLDDPQPQMFIAPLEIRKLNQLWGRDVFNQRYRKASDAFLRFCSHAISISRHEGQEAVSAAVLATVRGGGDPATAHILTLHGDHIDK